MSLPAFLDSWSLFAEPYLLTILAAMALSILGVVTAARRQVFMAAAVAQASTFGYAVFALIVGAAATQAGESVWRDVVVIGSAVAASLLTMIGDSRQTQGSRLDGDERTAWVFIFAGAGAILVLSQAAAGMEQFRRMQTSSVIGATVLDVAVFAVLLLVMAGVLIWAGRSIVLLLSDPVMAAAIGMRVRVWDLALALFSGACVGLGVRSTGMLFTFGCLALPVMIAKQACGEVRAMFWVSPLVAGVSALVGLWLSYHWDLPPGQVVVALLCVVLVVAVAARYGWDKVSR
ncbi:MAG: metal ABC transporter permease [Planctomycetota bacterium]